MSVDFVYKDNKFFKRCHGVLIEPNKIVRKPLTPFAPEIFVCEADGIMDADAKFFQSTGISAPKTPQIGVSFR